MQFLTYICFNKSPFISTHTLRTYPGDINRPLIPQNVSNLSLAISFIGDINYSTAPTKGPTGIKKDTKAWKDWWKKKHQYDDDLLMAAESGDITKVAYLLDKEQCHEFTANVEWTGLDNFTALHFAAQENNKDIMSILIDHGSALDAKSGIGRTPLHLASLRGNKEAVKLLVDHKADINCQDEDMYTPLHYASEFGNLECAEVLVKNKADLSLKNNIGAKPSDITMNVDLRKLISGYEDSTDVPNEDDTGSKRNMFHTVILHNDRKSYVQRLMGKYQKVDRYLKDVKNGNEEALIRNIEEQQRQRMQENKKVCQYFNLTLYILGPWNHSFCSRSNGQA